MSDSARAPGESVHYRCWPIAGVEAMAAATSRSFSRHTHDDFGIGIVDSGGHASCSGRGPVEAGPGTFITVNPGEVHDGHAVGGRLRAWRILYFDPGTISGWLNDVTGRDHDFAFAQPVFGDGRLRAIFEMAYAQGTQSVTDVMACETAVLGLIAGLRPHSTIPVRSESLATPDVRRARDRLDADPAAPITLEQLARECSLSRFQLLRAFARAYGLPPHAYLLQRRLSQARRLLRARMPVAEVAAASGFSDQSHLSRCFSRQFGVTPGRYSASG